jgi:hypothetical protein
VRWGCVADGCAGREHNLALFAGYQITGGSADIALSAAVAAPPRPPEHPPLNTPPPPANPLQLCDRWSQARCCFVRCQSQATPCLLLSVLLTLPLLPLLLPPFFSAALWLLGPGSLLFVWWCWEVLRPLLPSPLPPLQPGCCPTPCPLLLPPVPPTPPPAALWLLGPGPLLFQYSQ